jgi:hypothetical protein
MWRLSSICTNWYNVDDLMKPHGSVRVVRMWCGLRIDPILRCFNNLEGLNYGNLLVDIVRELANGLRLSTEVPSQDPSGAAVTV